MLDRNLKRWELALMFGLLCGLLGGFWLDREQTQLAGRVIRFHVIANSDSPEDQALKLQVRDRVLAETETFTPSAPLWRRTGPPWRPTWRSWPRRVRRR